MITIFLFPRTLLTFDTDDLQIKTSTKLDEDRNKAIRKLIKQLNIKPIRFRTYYRLPTDKHKMIHITLNKTDSIKLLTTLKIMGY